MKKLIAFCFIELIKAAENNPLIPNNKWMDSYLGGPYEIPYEIGASS